MDDKVPADDKAPVDDKFLVDDKVSEDDEVSVDEESSLKSDYINQQAWAVLKQLGNLQENVLVQLKKYDTIVVLDDSGSMTSEHRWEDVRFHDQQLALNFSLMASFSSRHASPSQYSAESSPNTTTTAWICIF